MYTYQDLINVGESDEAKMKFVQTVIYSHKSSEMYEEALTAREYDAKRNTTIIQYQKLLYTISGKAVPDNYSANYKLTSNFFNRFVTQQNQFLLGNGVSLADNVDKEKLGDDFDTRLQELGRNALVDGLSFGFWNYDHLEVFKLTEFVPLWDEETGALMAGVRFWQIDPIKPMRVTLYELDGLTEYIWRNGNGEVLKPKRKYVLSVFSTPAGDSEIIDGYNYPSFPIIPLWGNPVRQSELVGIREQIDCYDLIKSGFANDLDDASQIYWTISNAGGMDDIDLAKFIERMKTVKAAAVDDDGAKAESHTMEVPYASREALLERIRNDLYDNYMALDTRNLASGNATATQIRASYEPMNNKADMYEYCIRDFLDGLFYIVGIESKPTFTRSILINVQETVQVLSQAAMYLPEEYITKKLLETLGDGDQAEDILEMMLHDEMERAPINGEVEEDNGQGSQADGQNAQESGKETGQGVQ